MNTDLSRCITSLTVGVIDRQLQDLEQTRRFELQMRDFVDIELDLVAVLQALACGNPNQAIPMLEAIRAKLEVCNGRNTECAASEAEDQTAHRELQGLLEAFRGKLARPPAHRSLAASSIARMNGHA